MVKRAHNEGKAADHEVPQKRQRIDLSSSQINFLQPFKKLKLNDEDDKWVVSLGLKRLLDVMTDAKNLVEENALFKEFVQEFSALDRDPPFQYVTTIQSRTSPIEIDAELLASKFCLPHNYPSGTQLGGRESLWIEGYEVFENDGHNKKKGWRLEKLRQAYRPLKRRYELLHRLIWFAQRHDYIGNGQMRAIHGVCKPRDPLQQPDWATTVLCNLAQEIRKLQDPVKEGNSTSRRDKVTLIGPIIRHILDTLDDKENNEQALDMGGVTGGAATHLDRGQIESNRDGVSASRENETGGDDRCGAPTHLDSGQNELDKGGVASSKGGDGGGAATHTDSEQDEVEGNGVIVSRDNELASDKGGDGGGAATHTDSEQDEVEGNGVLVSREYELASHKGGDGGGAATHTDSEEGEVEGNDVSVSRDNELASDKGGDGGGAATHTDSEQDEVEGNGMLVSRKYELASDKGGDGGGAATHTDSEEGEVEGNGVIVSRDNELASDKGGDGGGAATQTDSEQGEVKGNVTCGYCTARRYHLSSLSTSVEKSGTSPYADSQILEIITRHLSFLEDVDAGDDDEDDWCDNCEMPYNDDKVEVYKSVLEFLDTCFLRFGRLFMNYASVATVAKAYRYLAVFRDLKHHHMPQRGETLRNIIRLLRQARDQGYAEATSHCTTTLLALGPYVNPSEFPDLLALALPLLKTGNEDLFGGSTVRATMEFLARIIVRDDDFFKIRIGSPYSHLSSFWHSFDSLVQNSRNTRVERGQFLKEDVLALLIKRLAVLQQQSTDMLLFQEMILTATLKLSPEQVNWITSSPHRSPSLSFAIASARLQQQEYSLAMEDLETIAGGHALSELPRLQESHANVLPVKLQAYRSLTFLKTILGDLDGALNISGLEETLRLQMEKAAASTHGDSRMNGITVGNYLDYDAVLEKSIILGLQGRLSESLAALTGHTGPYKNLHFSYAHKAYISSMMGERPEARRCIQQAVKKRLALKEKGRVEDMNWLQPQLSYLPISYKALFLLTGMAVARNGYRQEYSTYSVSFWEGQGTPTELVKKFEELAPCLYRISNYFHLSRAIREKSVFSTDLSCLCIEHLRRLSEENPQAFASCLEALESIKPCEDPTHFCSILSNFELVSDEQILEGIEICTRYQRLYQYLE